MTVLTDVNKLSVLNETSEKFDTKFWNDSCDLKELDYALENNCVGATTNPIIVKTVLENNLSLYEKEIIRIIEENPTLTEDDIAWLMIEKMALDGAKKLEPIFDPKTGTGRISMQTNTKYCKNPDLLLKQALHFASLAPNIQVKIPVTSAGVKAIEEATYHGISINATVCFSVPQAVAVAEAVERGLKRREEEGKDNSEITPVCTIMIGRTDDYIKKVIKSEDRLIEPEALEWAGIACAKKFYEIYKERNYKTKLLTAAFRNIHHWTALVGGDLLATIPAGFQKKINGSNVEIKEQIDIPVDVNYMNQLLSIPAFVNSYEVDGMTVEEFDQYGAVIDTLTQFYQGYDELVQIIRKYILR
ncbi:transaldolase [Bacillus sp. HMF5848]|uniref:transaldolase family protein n=1 Tax=Bacillus sp. HMF5848 TaxID=2495421 RepID=UPI000F7B18E3|nr:transaldolase family protein [Bacillus sp. HMF5848]RSK25717.1 transaldolase [Bacillus sp. HMF5848]